MKYSEKATKLRETNADSLTYTQKQLGIYQSDDQNGSNEIQTTTTPRTN